jgi:hypothetical protein
MVEALLRLVTTVLSVTYLVLDGHFGNHNALQRARQCNLQLISKLRCDAALYFPYTGPYTGRGPIASMAPRWLTTTSRCNTSKRPPWRDTSRLACTRCEYSTRSPAWAVFMPLNPSSAFRHWQRYCYGIRLYSLYLTTGSLAVPPHSVIGRENLACSAAIFSRNERHIPTWEKAGHMETTHAPGSVSWCVSSSAHAECSARWQRLTSPMHMA